MIGRPPKRRSGRDDSYCVDVDIAAIIPCLRLDLGDALRGPLERTSRCLREERIAVVQCKSASRRDDQRPAAAERLRLGADMGELDIAAAEIEVLLRTPGKLDCVEPFLSKFVARLVVALLDAEHLELVLVPADDEV